MGGKASNQLQADRPESGGSDKDMLQEKSGLLGRDQEKFAQQQAEMKAEEVPEQPEQSAGHAPFSIDNPPNNARRE